MAVRVGTRGSQQRGPGGKEYIGGIYVISAPDLDAALAWGRKAAAATTLPIEVRPFRDVPPF